MIHSNIVFNYHTFYKTEIANSLHFEPSEGSTKNFVSVKVPKFSGWYMIEVQVQLNEQYACASISFDLGKEFKGSGHHKILLKNMRKQKRIVFLRSDVKKITLSLDVSNEVVKIESFKFVKISSSFAQNRMKKKLRGQQVKVEGENGSISAIWRLYCSSFKNSYNLSYFMSFEGSYKAWILAVEKPGLPTKKVASQLMSSWDRQPLISIVLPVYNTSPKYLTACINSVERQFYPNWELCITDDASTNPKTLEVIKSCSAKDERIKVHYRKTNGHISKASNDAIGLATGDYIAFLDHDDMLSDHALYYIAKEINKTPSAKVIYSDEDWIDKDGRRLTPHFKSDWNPDLFFSHNYITHLAVYKSELLRKVRGLRVGVEGSQDYDLILRCLSYVKSEEIQHIPRVLYHWRAIEGSTALDSGEKSYTVEAGRKSLENYFEQTKQNSVKVEVSDIDNYYRVHWPVPSPEPSVTLIIPTRDMKETLEVAVSSIIDKTDYSNYKIIIVDNGSSQIDTLNYLNEVSANNTRTTVLKFDHEFNYSAINNYAVENSESDIIGLINNDVEVINGNWLKEMVSHACRLDIGCVGAKLYYPDDTIQHAGVIMGIGGSAAHSHRHFPREHPGYIGRLKMVQNLSGVTGACLLIRREVYNEVGGLDDINLKVAYNDVDFCLKVREAGYRNLWTPFAELYHHESLSRGYEDNPEKIARFKKETNFLRAKWSEKLTVDPFYNKNLTLHKEDFSIGFER